MGIQLSKHDRHMIMQAAELRRLDCGVHPLLYGYLSAGVDAFLTGRVSKEYLGEVYALCELLGQLSLKYSADELRQIASGTREVPGEDVHSGR